MNITTFELVTIVIAIIGGYWALAVLLMRQFNKSLDQRFDAQNAQRAEDNEKWTSTAQQVAKLEREFLEHKVQLVQDFVRREDYIRGQTVIEVKLDRLYTMMQYGPVQRGNADDHPGR